MTAIFISRASLVVGRRPAAARPAPATTGLPVDGDRQTADTLTAHRSPLDRRPATGDRRPATGDRRPATGDRRPATGDRRPATGGV
ncbi:hypothetical protein [Frankia sp. R43]|uniref:hypothetical protein n=1 Tax=Frankia sp. R43 TaxID=269536 RepID=UPI0013795BA5|nr:hypothetical protein [Frankia sp. R43]